MTTHLYLAPAGRGRTAYVLERIRQIRASEPLAPIAVILPNQAQVAAFRRRLSQSGGALGVSLGTFYALYPEVLAWAGQLEPRLPEPVQYRLISSLVARLADEGRLTYYAPLQDKPGFTVLLRALLEELKRAGIRREIFKEAIQALPHPEARLAELADIYTLYQDWLLDHGWADTEGQGWLAALALERQPELGRHLRLLIVDGFDEFNPTQLAALKFLAGRAADTIITLTSAAGQSPRPVLRRFNRALEAISQTLDLTPEPLPGQIGSAFTPALAHLESHLFDPQAPPFDLSPEAEPAITFVEAQTRAEEVRAALRWLKVRLVRDQMAPAELALIARDLAPYGPFIDEVAAEFGLTVYARAGLDLAANPAVAALMSLLALPLPARTGEGNWARRPLLDAWRSPYFENLAPGLADRPADRLDLLARQGLVIQGLAQWRAAFRQQLNRTAEQQAKASAAVDDEGLPPPDHLLPEEALALQHGFEAFVARLTPPPQATLREYAAFVEALIGDDPKLEVKDEGGRRQAEGEESQSLGIVNRAWAAPDTAHRDIAALRAFKDVLRGLVLAESALSPDDPAPVTYGRFYEDLRDTVRGSRYYPPPSEPLEAALPVLSVLDARGLSFRAAALIGLAEGEFPRAEREDILLREEDRQALRQAGLSSLASRLRGDEITFFYQAVTRAREKLLLARPYLAEDGHTWEPSPYWSEVHRLVESPVQHVRPEDPLPVSEVASWPELAQTGALAFLELTGPEEAGQIADRAARLQRSLAVLQARLAADPYSPFEGDLTALAGLLSARYNPEHVWSSSRLEAYGLCPHHFWLGQELALEPRQPPTEGFDVFILGTMYHEILEEVYRRAGDRTDAEHLLTLLPDVARQIFDRAPAAYRFRPTPLWEMQRPELEQILARTLTALAEATAGSTPVAQEQVFGLDDRPPLIVQKEGDEFRVRGFIDRVDRDSAGQLRIIDYKSGATPISARDLAEGRRLQIALYALAAREALALGEIAAGFYWHIGSARASSLKLEKFEGGVEGALRMAIDHAFNHVAGVRAGRFQPAPPPAGCPGHCPGASFCWRYKSKGW